MAVYLNRLCRSCGTTRLVPVFSQKDYDAWAVNGTPIIQAMPYLSEPQRIILEKGVCTDCYKKEVKTGRAPTNVEPLLEMSLMPVCDAESVL